MKEVAVYADWDGLPHPTQIGWLVARPGARGEVFSFEFLTEVLDNPIFNKVQLDLRLQFLPGSQYPAGRGLFGVFSDSSPDRWGRMLMERRLERDKRIGKAPATQRLNESDFLLGVHDGFRVGGLRFKLNNQGPFLDNQDNIAAPPFVRLRELEQASRALERDEDNLAEGANEWLQMLIAPGGSLGGARPKASVRDERAQLWIAKFPSIRDDRDMGAWEILAQTLARACGLKVSACEVRKFGKSNHHTFLIKRFDRTASGSRLHFASAMTLTGHQDGEDAATGVSYLEIAEVLIRFGAKPNEDLLELWSRIVFNMMVSNTDDHLRNHGFILEPSAGWRLSEIYDINPEPHSSALKLNISQYDNAMDLELALSVASLFRVSNKQANEIVSRFKRIIRQWKNVANGLGISSREQSSMASAFRVAG